MKIVNVNLYQYSELNNKAKEKAKNWFLNVSDFSFEWDCLKDDAKNIGVDLQGWDYNRYLNGSLILSAKDVISKILENHGESCETYKTAKYYEAKFKQLNEENEEEIQELTEEFEKSILEDYRIMADKEYDFTYSDEYIEDAMKANEYDFLEDGTRF